MSPVRRLLLLLVLAGTALRAEVAAVHPLVPERALTVERVQDILLGRVTTWQDGTAVILVLADDPAADTRIRELTGRDRERLVRGWKRLVFSGAGAMPLQAPSITEALATVARCPGAIAILSTVPPGDRWRAIPIQAEAVAQGHPAAP